MYFYKNLSYVVAHSPRLKTPKGTMAANKLIGRHCPIILNAAFIGSLKRKLDYGS